MKNKSKNIINANNENIVSELKFYIQEKHRLEKENESLRNEIKFLKLYQKLFKMYSDVI